MTEGNVAVQPAIQVQDLCVAFGSVKALDDVTFEAPSGAITALLGPNGAGKTTMVDVLCGFRRPDAGEARALGLDPVAASTELCHHMGVMLQQPGIHTGLRPAEVLDLFAAFYPDPLDPTALLREVGLADRADTSFRKLSGGEQQRLSMAVALVGRPQLVLLDEPTAGIDPEGKRLIRERITQLRDDGVSVLLTTHDLDEAERLADHVVIIDHGRAIASGTLAELTRGDERLRFSASPGLDVASVAEALGAPVTEPSRGDYEVAVPGTPALIAALAAWLADHDVPLGDLRAGKQRLEDVFLRLTAEASNAEAMHAAQSDKRGSRSRARGGRS